MGRLFCCISARCTCYPEYEYLMLYGLKNKEAFTLLSQNISVDVRQAGRLLLYCLHKESLEEFPVVLTQNNFPQMTCLTQVVGGDNLIFIL